jgi:N-acyl homoserine lactone hydrolase
MPSLKIYPLHLGTITRPKLTFFFGLAELAKMIEAPLIGWYIEGSDKRILVDTGGEDPAQAPHRAPYTREPDQTVDRALEKIGVRCEDIDTVVLTHLHWDHCSGIGLFPNAQILVQEEELKSARSPLPLHAGGYIKSIVESDTFTVIARDEEIAEGVSVILTPGHTYGMQGVLVEAETQRYFIASDTIGLFECLDQDPPVISGIYVDLRKYYESLEKIANLSAFILPGHDIKVFEREAYS